MTIFSDHTKEKAEKARLTIENFYQNFLFQQNEREERLESKENEICKFDDERAIQNWWTWMRAFSTNSLHNKAFLSKSVGRGEN
jgi:hypothetical protein